MRSNDDRLRAQVPLDLTRARRNVGAVEWIRTTDLPITNQRMETSAPL